MDTILTKNNTSWVAQIGENCAKKKKKPFSVLQNGNLKIFGIYRLVFVFIPSWMMIFEENAGAIFYVIAYIFRTYAVACKGQKKLLSNF